MDLQGACACGRNAYIIEFPDTSNQLAQVFYDNSSGNRRHLASPITAWLRVPLSWFHSTTFAFFPDESHSKIRRTFVSPFDDSTRRQFCGYCGTPLSQWQEDTHGDEEFINLTLGSLFEESLQHLQQMGMLQLEGEVDERDEQEEGMPQAMDVVKGRPAQGVAHRGAPWFEEMVEHTPLGRLKRQKGGHTSSSNDGTVEVEWEVFEWTGDEQGEDETSTKRKFGEVEEVDTEMK